MSEMDALLIAIPAALWLASLASLVCAVLHHVIYRRKEKSWDSVSRQAGSGTSRPLSPSRSQPQRKSLPRSLRREPAIGFRAFRIYFEKDENKAKSPILLPLVSAIRGSAGLESLIGEKASWRPGGVASRCRCNRGCGVDSPGVHCGCGLYACRDVSSVYSLVKDAHLGGYLSGSGVVVVGVVMGWGKVIQHGGDGWRAQYAKVVALSNSLLGYGTREGVNWSPPGLIGTLAQKYQSAVIDLGGLELYAKEFGSVFPVEEK
jgi:hypothetical protein